MSKRGRNSPKKIVFASTRLRNNKKSPSTEVERPLIFLHVFFILTDSEKILGNTLSPSRVTRYKNHIRIHVRVIVIYSCNS